MKNTGNISKPDRLTNITAIGINMIRKNMHMWTGCLFLLLLALASPLHADETRPHRGEFPTCQSACLAAHTTKMEKLMDGYRHDSNRLLFQDGIDKAVSEYRACIDDCRDPMPVK
ncbi:MAG: hypothetical protein A4E65_03509 [Syntrophorhabdus sp. PtaU1.Bin153]|nr:MAG: hypothetical protein A4E65_03509 [Syntrophorhabdus sp. PtaU1.Bin153]